MPEPTVSVTFDNLGEASELERGTWPQGRPLGEHFSVREALPQLLGMLAAEDIRATFFVEGLNGELYPEALSGMVAAGHEVACHGWRHEDGWAELDAARERELLARAHAALGAPTGFRPPGGELTASSAGLLTELGFTYCSPAGERAGRLGDLAVLPFRWPLIDAYYYLPHFAGLRRANGDPEEPMTAAALRDAVLGALAAHVHGQGHLVLLFHPFLLSEPPDALSAVAEALARVGELARGGDLRCVRMDEAAASVRTDRG
jgi:peptidoglycan/xylan/chitin deacetylase (PgdA/CDA1 family)